MTAMRQRPSTLLARSLVCAVRVAACAAQRAAHRDARWYGPGGTSAPQGTTEGQAWPSREATRRSSTARTAEPQGRATPQVRPLCDLATSICSVQRSCAARRRISTTSVPSCVARRGRVPRAQESCVGASRPPSRTPPNQTVPPARLIARVGPAQCPESTAAGCIRAAAGGSTTMMQKLTRSERGGEQPHGTRSSLGLYGSRHVGRRDPSKRKSHRTRRDAGDPANRPSVAASPMIFRVMSRGSPDRTHDPDLVLTLVHHHEEHGHDVHCRDADDDRVTMRRSA